MKRDPVTLDAIKNTAAGRLESNKHLFMPVKVKKEKKVSKEKYWIQHTLEVFAKERGLILSTEYVFHQGRKWRFDWSFNEIKYVVEYEGIMSKKSRHTTTGGYTGDTDKYNIATLDGWEIHRYTALNYLDLRIDLLHIKI